MASIIAARVLGRTVFGEFGMIQSTLNMFMTFANLGVGLTATKYVAEFRKTDPQRAGRIIAMSTAMAAVLGTAVGVVLVATSSWVAL
jgi:O-antigen/teichoic acid export membrane protein